AIRIIRTARGTTERTAHYSSIGVASKFFPSQIPIQTPALLLVSVKAKAFAQRQRKCLVWTRRASTQRTSLSASDHEKHQRVTRQPATHHQTSRTSAISPIALAASCAGTRGKKSS